MARVIEILDSVECKANVEARKIIKYALAYKKEFRKREYKYGRVITSPVVNTQHYITGRHGTSGRFFTGLLPRVIKYSDSVGKPVKITGERDILLPERRPILNGIKFRPDQKKALRKIKKNHTGVILHPTGTGKTILEMGVISMFPNTYTLLLAHTKDLVRQLVKAAKEHLCDMPIYSPAGIKEINEAINEMSNKLHNSGEIGGVLITTIQSFSKATPEQYSPLFDIVIIDEGHHVTKPNSQYGKVLTHMLAARRYGFTATLPTKKEYLLFNEGMFGPVIAELKIEDAIEMGLVAVPKIAHINVPYDTTINSKCASYKSYYKYGVVQNKKRNALICEHAVISIALKHPTLIIIEKIKQGRLIKIKMRKAHDIKIPFIHGGTSTEKRDRVKEDLITGEITCAIVSRIWMEGINIPNLMTIIYAPGMKEKKKVIQAMGRGLRTSRGKESILLIDFLDPYKYLAEHSVLRMQTYNELGWL